MITFNVQLTKSKLPVVASSSTQGNIMKTMISKHLLTVSLDRWI